MLNQKLIVLALDKRLMYLTQEAILLNYIRIYIYAIILVHRLWGVIFV